MHDHFREDQIAPSADLSGSRGRPKQHTCVIVIELGGGGGVPEADAAVGGAAPRRQQPMLVRGPRYRFNLRQGITTSAKFILHIYPLAGETRYDVDLHTNGTTGVTQVQS